MSGEAMDDATKPTCEGMWPFGECPKCHSEDVEPVTRPSEDGLYDLGVHCHSCGRTSWLDPNTNRWPT